MQVKFEMCEKYFSRTWTRPRLVPKCHVRLISVGSLDGLLTNELIG